MLSVPPLRRRVCGSPVAPAKAGAQESAYKMSFWIPAYAGMTAPFIQSKFTLLGVLRRAQGPGCLTQSVGKGDI